MVQAQNAIHVTGRVLSADGTIAYCTQASVVVKGTENGRDHR